jgi:cell division protein FtsL
MRRYLVHVILGFAVMASALGVVYSKHESRRLFVSLQNLEGERDAMNIDWGRLQLEQSTWATHARIAASAEKKLGMKVPDMNDITIITTGERVGHE